MILRQLEYELHERTPTYQTLEYQGTGKFLIRTDQMVLIKALLQQL